MAFAGRSVAADPMQSDQTGAVEDLFHVVCQFCLFLFTGSSAGSDAPSFERHHGDL